MANRQNGEVSIEVGDTNYTMALTLDAMVALEDMFDTTFQEVVAAADRGSMKHLRAMLWASLQLHHPSMEVKDISPLIQQAGGLAVFAAKFMELAKATMADPKDLEALGVKPGTNPPRAQGEKKTRGTGVNSTSRPVASA